MAHPDSIQISPLTVPVQARISIPGSKSLTNRALILAALGTGPCRLEGALWAEDTELMVEALRKLGFSIQVEADPTNPCNRTLTVTGQGGKIPVSEAELFVGTAGTAARFLSAFCALGKGPYRLHGTERMHQRPMKEVFEALRSAGGKVEDQCGKLPAIISGPLPRQSSPMEISVANSESSQFASALILISRAANLRVTCPSSPYVEMSRKLLADWKENTSLHAVEPDASSASYFVALERLHGRSGNGLQMDRWGSAPSTQVDRLMAEDRFWPVPPELSRKKDLNGDAILTLVIAAAAQRRPLRLTDAGNLRKQECDRITALVTELRKCGVPAEELPEGLVLKPAEKFKKAVIHTWKDHRIAMCFALLGTMDVMGDGKPWLTLEDPGCVGKTFPNFFETLESVARQSRESSKSSL